VRWFFEALSVAEIDAAAGTLQEADRRRNQLLSTRRQEVERLRYQASFAARQYNHTDPENRLVAAELERRWEEALQELKEAEERLQKDEQETTCWAIPADLLEDLKSFGPRLPELWKQGLFSVTQQKSLLRCLVDKVVLRRMESDTVRVRVVWRGGATTSDDVRVPVGSLTRLSNFEEMEEVILRMANEGHRDEQIANWLTEHGYRSPLREVVLRSTVQKVRLRRGLKHRKGKPHPRQVAGYLTVSQIAEELEIPREWICSQIRKGTIRPEENVRNRCHLFPDKPETLRKFGQLYRGEIKRLDD
jgi:hypothetical protein